MTFDLSFSETSLSELKKLSQEEVERIFKKLESTSSDPYHFFERLVGREEYKLRIGDYRIIARILPTEKRIFIQSLGHRKNIYKK